MHDRATMTTTHTHDKKRRFVARDSRVLIAAFAALVSSTFVVKHIAGFAVILAYVLLVHRLAVLPFHSLLRHLRGVALVMVLVVGVNSVLVSGDPLPYLPFLSREGVASGVFFAVRLLVLYLTMLLLVALVSPEAIAKTLSAFVAPFSRRASRRMALYGFLALGFLPLFGDEYRRIVTAQRFRGGGLEGGVRRKLGGVRLLLVPLLLSAIHRSAQLAMVVELRGLKESVGEALVFGRPASRDYVFALATALVIVLAVGGPGA